MAELLIAHGCMVNACDKKDRRPLHYAAYQGHEDLVRLLLNHGADVNVKDKGVSFHISLVYVYDSYKYKITTKLIKIYCVYYISSIPEGLLF